MIARHDALGHLLRDHGGADGEPVAERFRGGEDVRVSRRRKVLVGPEAAGAGEAALDFVVDEDGADVVAAAAERGQERGRGDVDAAFALDGLDDDAAGALRDELLEAGFVVEGAVDETRDHGAEGFLVFRVRRRGQTAHGAAVEGAVEADDFVLRARWTPGLADFAGEFDGGFVGFGAGVADEDFGGAGHGAGGARLLDHELREGADPWGVVEIGRVDEGPRLLSDQLCHLGVAVTQCVDRYAGGEVEEFPVLNVPEVAPFAFDHHGRRADIGRYHIFGMLADDCSGLRVAWWIRTWERGFLLYAS